MMSVRGLYCMFIKMTSAPPRCKRLDPFVERSPEVIRLDLRMASKGSGSCHITKSGFLVDQ